MIMWINIGILYEFFFWWVVLALRVFGCLTWWPHMANAGLHTVLLHYWHTVSYYKLDCLQFDFGISGSALNWIESYLSNRTQRIYIDGVLSSNFNLKFGVPQGSCLGPLLFSLYASKLFKIIESHLPNPHCYADDMQLYIAFRSGNYMEETAAITAMESCIAVISQWMHSDKLKLHEFG